MTQKDKQSMKAALSLACGEDSIRKMRTTSSTARERLVESSPSCQGEREEEEKEVVGSDGKRLADKNLTEKAFRRNKFDNNRNATSMQRIQVECKGGQEFYHFYIGAFVLRQK